MNRRLILLIAVMLNLWASTQAQEVKDSVYINFRQSKVNLDTAYMGNRERLTQARRRIAELSNPDSMLVLNGVSVVGGASPEGSVQFNEWLSRERAARIFQHLSTQISLPDSITSFVFLGRDWQGLRSMVAKDENTPYRGEVLSLLDKIISNTAKGEQESAGNLARLKRLRGGVPYLYMYNNMFPTLRASKLVLSFGKPQPLEITLDTKELVAEAPKMPAITLPDTIRKIKPLQWYPPCKPFYMDISTNMLYDILAIPNIAVEFYLAQV